MSVQAMSWALEQKLVQEATARHVLLCLANYADKTGRGAFPSAASLSEDTGLSVRTVRYKLDTLAEIGAIRLGNQAIAAAYIDRHDRRPVVYDLAIERGAADAPRSERGADEDTTGCSSRHNGVQLTTERGAAAAPNPSTNHQLTINKPKEGADALFSLAASAASNDAKDGDKPKSGKFDPLTAKPENASETSWADFCEMRKMKRAPLTARACELIAKKLLGHADADGVLDKSTVSCWTDIYPDSILPRAGERRSKAAMHHAATQDFENKQYKGTPDDQFADFLQ